MEKKYLKKRKFDLFKLFVEKLLNSIQHIKPAKCYCSITPNYFPFE